MAADPEEPMDVATWTQEQITGRSFIDHEQIEKLVRIAATEGIEAALEHLDGTPEEDEEAYQAALRALDDEGDNE